MAATRQTTRLTCPTWPSYSTWTRQMRRRLKLSRIRLRHLRLTSDLRQKPSAPHFSRLYGPATRSSSLWRSKASTSEFSSLQMKIAQVMKKISSWLGKEPTTWPSLALTLSFSQCPSQLTQWKNLKTDRIWYPSLMCANFTLTLSLTMKTSSSRSCLESKAPNPASLSSWSASDRKSSKSARLANACLMSLQALRLA